MNDLFRIWLDKRIEDGLFDRKKTGGGFPCNAANTEELLDSLLEDLPSLLHRSSGLYGETTPRRAEFHLGHERGTLSPQTKEAKAERALFSKYRSEQGKQWLTNSPSAIHLSSIHSFQVPLYPSSNSGLGEIDLLGATQDGLPAIIELKAGKKSGGVGALLGPIIQGLAYALTLRHLWRHPQSELSAEWAELNLHSCPLPSDLQNEITPIIVAADSLFWDPGRTWKLCPWSKFVQLSNALMDCGFPLLAARFEDLDRLQLKIVPFQDLQGFDAGQQPLKWS